jgi:hypothetical protein
MPIKIVSSSPVTNPQDASAPAQVPADRPSSVRVRRIPSLARFEERAPDELAAYFARKRSGEPLRPEDADVEAIFAGRQLEVLAQLFRERKMPADGVDILEGVASRCTWAEIAEPLELEEEQATGRYRRMKDTYRRRMTKLGLLPDMVPLRLIVSEPRAISRLRGAA